ncbi:MAG: hypothetical protein ACLRR3_08135 [Eubacterium sp.]
MITCQLLQTYNSKPKKPTASITKLAKEFGFKVRFCGTRKPETKGCVEAKNKVVDWIRAYEGEFEGLEELTAIIEIINKDIEYNHKPGNRYVSNSFVL